MLRSLAVPFIAVTQGIDTDQSNPTSRLLLHMFAAFAEFERELIKERAVSGMKAAKKAGKSFGRPKPIFNRDDVHELRAGGGSLRDIAKQLGSSLGAVTRTLAEAQEAEAALASTKSAASSWAGSARSVGASEESARSRR